MVELILEKISRFVRHYQSHYRDDQRTVTNCGAQDESIVRESKSLLRNGESEHLSARRDRIGNNYPSHASPSECEAITQCLIAISERVRSRGHVAPRASVAIANFDYRDLDRALDAPTIRSSHPRSALRPRDFALDKFIPPTVNSRSAGRGKSAKRWRGQFESLQLRTFQVAGVRRASARNECAANYSLMLLRAWT